MGHHRYAIYYVPAPLSPLGKFGAHWLGRDVATNAAMPQPSITSVDAARLAALTAAPRHYGFHATLKPPFRLADHYDLNMLDESLEAFAVAQVPFNVPALEVANLDGFIALRPRQDCKALHSLAKACVREFDGFRAPQTDAELQKRLQAELTDKQVGLLKKWGYPYVMSEYRFHLTLTERLKGKERQNLMAELERLAKDVLSDQEWMIDAITLVRQNARDEPFTVVKSYAFRSPRPR